MPAGYVKIRDAFKKKGMSDKAAKKKAAMIWNSKHKGAEAVGRYSESEVRNPEERKDVARNIKIIRRERDISKKFGVSPTERNKKSSVWLLNLATGKRPAHAKTYATAAFRAQELSDKLKKNEEFCQFMDEYNYSGKDSKGNFHYPQGAQSALTKIDAVHAKKELARKQNNKTYLDLITTQQKHKVFRHIGSDSHDDAILKPMFAARDKISDAGEKLDAQSTKIGAVASDIRTGDAWDGERNEPKNYPPFKLKKYESFCSFMEARWEKPTPADKEKAYSHYGKTKYSTSQKNTKTQFHRRAEIDKLKFSAPRNPSWDMDPRRVTDLLKQDVHEGKTERKEPESYYRLDYIAHDPLVDTDIKKQAGPRIAGTPRLTKSPVKVSPAHSFTGLIGMLDLKPPKGKDKLGSKFVFTKKGFNDLGKHMAAAGTASKKSAYAEEPIVSKVTPKKSDVIKYGDGLQAQINPQRKYSKKLERPKVSPKDIHDVDEDTKYWKEFKPGEFDAYLKNMKQAAKPSEPKKVSPEKLAQLRADAEAAKKKNEGKTERSEPENYYRLKYKRVDTPDEYTKADGNYIEPLQSVGNHFGVDANMAKLGISNVAPTKADTSGRSKFYFTQKGFDKVGRQLLKDKNPNDPFGEAGFPSGAIEKFVVKKAASNKAQVSGYSDDLQAQLKEPKKYSKKLERPKVSPKDIHDVDEDTSGLVGGGGNEGNEQGVAGAATSSKTLKSPKSPEKAIKKPDEIKPVNTTMKEAFCKFMEDRGERLAQDAKHSGKYERGGRMDRNIKTSAPDLKLYHEWPGETARKDKAMRHGYRQSVKRDIAKAVEESFKAAQAKIASKEGVSKEKAGAILAASSRNASAKAKRKNPKLKKVKG